MENTIKTPRVKGVEFNAFSRHLLIFFLPSKIQCYDVVWMVMLFAVDGVLRIRTVHQLLLQQRQQHEI